MQGREKIVKPPARGRIQRKTWCIGPYDGIDYNIALCQLQHKYHGQTCARVDLNPMLESTLSPRQGLKIWLLCTYKNKVIPSSSNFKPPSVRLSFNRELRKKPTYYAVYFIAQLTMRLCICYYVDQVLLAKSEAGQGGHVCVCYAEWTM